MLSKLQQLQVLLNLNEIKASDDSKGALCEENIIIDQLNTLEQLSINIDQEEEIQQTEYLNLILIFGSTYLKNVTEINLEIKVQNLSDKITFIIGSQLQLFSQVRRINFTIFSDSLVGNQGFKNLCQEFDKLSQLEDFFFMIGENTEVINKGFNFLTRNLRYFENLKHLNLIQQKNNKLSDQACLFLAESFTIFKNLKSLKLEIVKNNLSRIGSEFLHVALKNLTHLEEFSYTIDQAESLGDSSLFEFADSLFYLENLQTLSLNIPIIDIKEESLNKFKNSFLNLKLLKAFRFFMQDENQLDKNLISLLFQALSVTKDITFLEIHIGQTNFLCEQGCQFIQNWMKQTLNLEQLDLIIECENFIGNGGLIALSNGIKHLDKLKVLYISIDDKYNEEEYSDKQQEQIDVVSTQELAIAIRELKLIEEIRLDINSVSSLNLLQIILNQNIQFSSQIELNHFKKINFFKFSKEQSKQSLQKLSFSVPYAGIKLEGAKALSMGLQQMQELVSLSIQMGFGNGIGTDGAFEISEALKKLMNLEILNLNFSYSKLNESGGFYIIDAIKQLKLLKSLIFVIGDQNQIQKSNIIELGNTIQTLKNLKYLKVIVKPGNKIKETGIITFLESLSSQINLNHLHLDLFIDSDSYLSRRKKMYCDYFLNLSKLYSLSFRLKNQILEEINPQRKLKRLVCYQSKYQINQIN